MAPYFVFGGAYRSTLNLINPTEESVAIQLIAEDGSGRAIGESVEQTLVPGEGIRSGIQELFEIATIQTFPLPLVTGYIRIKESQNQPLSLIGSVEIASSGQGTFQQSAMSYPLGGSVSGTWIIPLALGDHVLLGICHCKSERVTGSPDRCDDRCRAIQRHCYRHARSVAFTT